MPFGRPSRRLRSVLIAPLLEYSADVIYIERGARFGDGSKIRLGHRSNLGIDCRLHGPVDIGDDVMMAPGVVIYGSAHGTNVDRPMWEQSYPPERRVTIKNDVWIGTRAIILPGVTIGSHAIIGAGAIISRDVKDGECVVGSVGRVIRVRDVSPEVRALYPKSDALNSLRADG